MAWISSPMRPQRKESGPQDHQTIMARPLTQWWCTKPTWSRSRLSASAQRSSEGGKCVPISPSPAAPSRARSGIWKGRFTVDWFNPFMTSETSDTVTAALLVGTFLAALDLNVVGTALPTMVGQLGGLQLYGLDPTFGDEPLPFEAGWRVWP